MKMVFNHIKFLILIKQVSATNTRLEGPISHRQGKKKPQVLRLQKITFCVIFLPLNNN